MEPAALQRPPPCAAAWRSSPAARAEPAAASPSRSARRRDRLRHRALDRGPRAPRSGRPRDDRGDRAARRRRRRHGHRRALRPPRASPRSTRCARGSSATAAAWTCSSTTSGAATRSSDWGAPFWEHDLETGLRACAQRRRDAPDHLAPARAAAGGERQRPRGRGDRRRQRPLPRLALLRPREGLGDPPRARRRPSELAPHGVTAVVAHAGVPALGGDARPLRRRPRRTGATASRRIRTSRSRRRRPTSAARSPRSPPTRTWRAGTARRSRPGGWPASTASRDVDGSQPDWGRWFDEVVMGGLDPLERRSRSTAEAIRAAAPRPSASRAPRARPG